MDVIMDDEERHNPSKVGSSLFKKCFNLPKGQRDSRYLTC